MKAFLCSTVGAIGSTIAFLLGGWDEAIQTLLLFMLIDYAMGFLLGAVFKKSKKSESGALESKACFKGLCKKGVILFFVIIGNRLDMITDSDFIRNAICIAFMTNELISITENAGLMGVPIPNVVMNAIDILKRKDEQNGKSFS